VLLAVDIGNTNTVLGVFDGPQLIESWRVKTDARDTADELALGLPRAARLDQGRRGGGLLHGAGRCWRSCGSCWSATTPTCPRSSSSPGVRTGVPLLYDNPKELGSDRIVNALAAYHRYGGPSIVVDFGTSTNFDIVSAKGEFVGGVLAPGIEISIDALASRAPGCSRSS
jgi:type III pantothenate kinase